MSPDHPTEMTKFGEQFSELPLSGNSNSRSEDIPVISKNSGKGKMAFQPFPMFSPFQRKCTPLTLKANESTDFGKSILKCQGNARTGLNAAGQEKTLRLYHPQEEIPIRECHLQLNDQSCDFRKEVQTHNFFKKKSIVVSTSLQEEIVGSSSMCLPYGSNSRKNMRGLDEKNRLNDGLKEHSRYPGHSQIKLDQHNYHHYSAVVLHDKKSYNLLDSHFSETGLACHKDSHLLPNEPSTSKNQFSFFTGKSYLQDHFGNKLSPSYSHPTWPAGQEDLYHVQSSQPKHSFFDVKTTGICTGTSSSEDLPVIHPKIAQTTRHLFFTEQTGVDLCGRGQLFKESTVSTKFEGNALSEFVSVFPNRGFHSQQGIKLQPLWSSTDSEDKENIGGSDDSAVVIRNESSADTNTLDMNAVWQKHCSGEVSSPSRKDATAAAYISPKETGGIDTIPNTELPDTSQKFLTLPAMSNSVDGGEPTASKTQSLDVDNLLSHADHVSDAKLKDSFGSLLGPEPECRWVKRLKMTASESLAHGTKSSKLEDTSSSEKVNATFNKLMKRHLSSSDAAIAKNLREEEVAFDQLGGSSSSDSAEKSRSALHSHPWIQRWCRNGKSSNLKKLRPLAMCELEKSKSINDNLQKKQFPSITAMALMAKAMTGLNPCEYRKRGSLVVWNNNHKAL